MSTLKTLFIFLFSIISITLTAQQYIGFKIGFLITDSDFDFGISDYRFSGKGIARPTLMLSSEFETLPYHSFAPNIHFTQTGNKMWLEDSLHRFGDNRIDYIGINLINKFKVFSSEYEIYGILGPQLRWAVNAVKVRSSSSSSSLPMPLMGIKERVDFDELGLKRLDMNLRTGAGLSKVNKNYKIILEWVYDFHFFNINSKPLLANRNYKNTGVLVGLMFKLNKENNGIQ